jgi:YD repeat-containing protein
MSAFPHYFTMSSTDVGAQPVYYFEVSKSPQFTSHVLHFEGTKPTSSHILTTYGLDSAQYYYVRASVVLDHTVSGYSNVLQVFTIRDPNIVFLVAGGGDVQQPFNFNILPPSPEAAALAKYADIPVSLYSGTPAIGIPLYELTERNLKLPISLSYHGSGNKVEQVATRTGLGWTLNAGGVVTRVVRGWPDEHPTRGFLVLRTQFSKVSDIVTLPNDSETKFETYDAMASDCKDGEPDLFYFNFAGYSGQFMYDWDGTIKILSGNSIKIEPLSRGTGDYFTGWTITVDDGTQYKFSKPEFSDVVPGTPTSPGCDRLKELSDKQMPQSWYLEDIFSADALANIHFTYEGYTQFTETDGLITEVYDLMRFQNGTPLNPGHYTVKTSYAGQNVKTITTTSGQTTITFDHASQPRTDVYSDEARTSGTNNNYPLGRMRVANAANRPIVNWDFGYSYVTGRLTLESVTETTGAVAKPPYKFTYDGSIPGDINSTEVDHWGFYNSNPGSMLPATAVHIPFSPQNEKQPLPGGDRSPDPDRVHAGMLKEIIYPTGGKDVLTFESHDYSFQQHEEILVTDIIHNTVNSGAPVAGVREDSQTFVLHEATDLQLDYSFSFAEANSNITHHGGGTKNPAVYLYYDNGSRTTDLFHLIPSINTDNFGNGTTVIYGAFPGTYTLTAVGYDDVVFENDEGITHNNGVNSASIRASWNTTAGPPRTEIRQGGGVRIKQIVRSFNNGNPDKVTRYDYRMVEDGKVKSSGSLLEAAQIYEMMMQYAKPSEIAPNSNGYDLEDRFIRFSRNHTALGTTQGSHVGYSQVTVFEGANGENGKSVYHYDSPREVGDFIELDIPFPPAQSFDFERGLLLDETVFSASGDTVRYVKNDYSFNVLDISGLKVGWRYPGTGPTGPGENLMARYAPGPYVNTLGYSRLTATHEKLFSTGAPALETVTTFSYNESTHKQLTQKSVVDSKGDTFVTSYKYPLDYSTPSAPISRMRSAHIDNVPVETLTWKVGTGSQVFLLAGLKTNFVIDHAGNSALPQTRYGAAISDPVATSDPYGLASTLYEPRLVIGQYDNFNNPLQSATPDGKTTAYQWGYTNTLLVAVAENASSANMFYEGFEDDGSATTAQQRTGKKSKSLSASTYSIPSNRLPQAGGDYILSYWVKEGSAWTYQEKPFNGYTTGAIATNSITGYLDDVRLYPKGALMTTYTYEPLAGMTSVTDAGNMTTYYEYDDYGRLRYVRDNDGNIVQSIDYQYQSPVLYRPISDQ